MVVAPAGAGASGAGAAGGTGGVGGVGPPTPLVTDARQGYTATNMRGELYLVSEEKLRELDATVLAYGAPRSQARRKVEVEYMERPPGEQPVRTPREAWVYVWPAALGLPLGLPEVRPAGNWRACLAERAGGAGGAGGVGGAGGAGGTGGGGSGGKKRKAEERELEKGVEEDKKLDKELGMGAIQLLARFGDGEELRR